MAYDWTSLVNSGVSLGSKMLGDKLAPPPELMNAQTNQQQSAESIRLAREKMARADQIRQMMMPGMRNILGIKGNYTPTSFPGSGTSYQPGSTAPPSGTGQPGLGSKVLKGAAGIGAGMLPAVIGALGKGAAAGAAGAGAAGAGAAGGLGSTIAGLATNPITIAAAGALVGGLLWKKSQVHPTADKWVQGEQNPFDAKMAAVDQGVQAGSITPEQAKQTKQTNAQNYLTALQQFAQMGGKEAQVAKQAADTFRQWYGDPMQYGVQLGF